MTTRICVEINAVDDGISFRIAPEGLPSESEMMSDRNTMIEAITASSLTSQLKALIDANAPDQSKSIKGLVAIAMYLFAICEQTGLSPSAVLANAAISRSSSHRHLHTFNLNYEDIKNMTPQEIMERMYDEAVGHIDKGDDVPDIPDDASDAEIDETLNSWLDGLEEKITKRKGDKNKPSQPEE